MRAARPPLWATASAAALLLIVAFTLTRPPLVVSDTIALVRGSESLQLCLHAGVTSHCDRYAAPPRGKGVDPWPPYQHLVVAGLLELGLSTDAIYRGLQLLNVAALLGLALLLGLVGRRTGRAWAAPLLVLLVIASPLAWYTWSTFSEAAAVTLCAAVAAAALLRAPPWALLVLVWLAGITKETAAPFLFALAAVCLLATPLSSAPLRRGHWLAIGAGAVLAIATHAGLNELRFGQLTNAIYLHPGTRVEDLGIVARFAVSLWLAPNGGTAFFWPAITGVLAGLVAIVVARRGRAPTALVLLALLAAHTVLLSSWYSPFGWHAWGPRLVLPLLPALAIAAVVLHLDAFERVLRSVGRHMVARIAVAAVLVVTTIPQVAVLTEPEAVNALFFRPPVGAGCVPTARVVTNPGGYYGCVIDIAWRRESPLVDAAGGALQGLGPLLVLATSASVVLLVLAATNVAATSGRRHELA